MPQWGGIFIFNPELEGSLDPHISASQLNPAFSAFANQLLHLLGVPRLPASISTVPSSEALTDWQVDALLRKRALENAQGTQETLNSIVKLVDQIENMPVGQDVRGDVYGALGALDQVCYHRNQSTSSNVPSSFTITLPKVSRVRSNRLLKHGRSPLVPSLILAC